MNDLEQQESPRFWDRGLVWFGLFGVMAAVGLFVISPKYEIRRSKMDLNFKGREISYEVRLKQRDDFLAAHPEAVPSPSPAFRYALWLTLIPVVALVVSLGANLYLWLAGQTVGFGGPRRELPQRE